jgi:hypothetical protein
VVDDVVSPPPSQHYHYDESSEASWHYHAPKPDESSAVQVTYPTPRQGLSPASPPRVVRRHLA